MSAKHKCEIDGVKYEFFHISPRPLRRVLIKVVGKLAKGLNPDADLSAEALDKDIKELFNVGHIINNLDQILNENDIEEIENVLFSECSCYYPIKNDAGDYTGQVKVRNVKKDYDVVFQDNFFDSILLLKEAFVCYYSNFFQKAGNVINHSGLKELAKK